MIRRCFVLRSTRGAWTTVGSRGRNQAPRRRKESTMSPNPTSLAGAPLPPQIAAPVSELLPPDIAPAVAQPPDIIFTLPADHASEETLRIIRIGHSSVMVQWGHDTLLTDPWFSQKRSHPGYYPGESLAMGIGRIDVAFVAINGLSLKQRNYHQLSMTGGDAAALCKRLDVNVVIPIHYAFHGNWASDAFMLSHRGTPEALVEAARAQSPKTTVMTLTPGQRLDVNWGYGARSSGGPAEQKKASLLGFFAKLNAGDLSAFELFTPDFVHHHPLPG